MNLETLYKSYRTDKDCKELLLQSHWFASFADFDPKTGETLPMSLNKALDRIATRQPTPFVKDRLWLLMKHSEEAARRLMKSLSEEPRREPAYLPIRDVRELDTASFIALSRRPGRNIREKLADKPYMQAVRHYQSIDVPENRLLKTYLMQLADALELRKEHLHDKSSEDFLQSIYRWLNEEEIGGIARWENLTPNNTLLSHRDYRRIWNSWRLLQTIEEDLDRDMRHLAQRREVRAKWEGLAKKYASGNTVFADMPILVDYNKFRIDPWDKSLPSLQTRGIAHTADFFETNEPVCLDMTQIQPVFATPTQSGRLSDSFFWQRWSRGDEQVDLELFDSDAVYVHGNATTVTCCDMFFFKGDVPEVLNQASRSFSLRLREHFHNGRMIWLTPDSLNDFELELVRRNINAGFSKADPVPCSVAAVFEHIDYSRITHDGYKVAVVERINGKAYLTEMVARYDGKLKESLPETGGFIWEKGISELISRDVEVEPVEGSIYILGKDGKWTKRCNPYGVAHKTGDDTIMAYEGFDCAIWLNGRPVKGGIRLYQLQSQVADIPLWRNHIPELITKVMMDGFYQPFYFVGKDVTVQPVRGKAVRINVPQEFTLPKGKKTYRLPLLQGSNEEALEYEAKLVSKDFPYSEDVKCRLNMTYTYGADDPYRLVFVPMDNKYKPISVIWQLKEDVEIDDAPGPAYPQVLTWHDLQYQTSPKTGERSDFLDWVTGRTKDLIDKLYPTVSDAKIREYLDEPQSGIIQWDSWGTGRNGGHYVLIKTSTEERLIFEDDLIAGVKAVNCSKNDVVYFFEHTSKKGKTYSSYISKSREATISAKVKDEVARLEGKYSKWTQGRANQISGWIHIALYVPYIRVWSDGRSINDPDCPPAFRRQFENMVEQVLDAALNNEIPENLRSELLFLLSCCYVDLPRNGQAAVNSFIRSSAADEKAIGVYLGNLPIELQGPELSLLGPRPAKSIFAILANAIWRQESFIDVLTAERINTLCVGISQQLSKFEKNDFSKLHWEKLSANIRYLELLLGLLRSRNLSDPDKAVITQPNTDLAKELARTIESIIAKAVTEGCKFPSRVQFEISGKAEDDKTPDLLYALHLYLTGDASVNAIRVTGIVDDE